MLKVLRPSYCVKLMYSAKIFYLQVLETIDQDVKCLVKNSATLAGSIFTMHASQVKINLPTLTSADKQVIFYFSF